MQIGYCPAISLVGETSVSGSLYAMDCHINAAVETGYNRLFGPGGAFVEVSTARKARPRARPERSEASLSDTSGSSLVLSWVESHASMRR